MKSDWRGKSLFELSQDLFLTQHVKDNTREDAVLDLIFSSEPGMIDNLDVREKFGEGFKTYSDHIIITYDMIRTEMKTVQKCTFSSILNKCRNNYVPKKTGRRRKKIHVDG